MILFGHLWVVEEIYIQIFAFKFNFRCQQHDFVPIICHWSQRYRQQICRRCRWYRWQFATGVVDTGSKFAAGIVDSDGKSTTQGELVAKFAAGVVDTGCKFAAGVVDTGGNLPPVSLTQVVHLDLRISPRIFKKSRNDPKVIIRGVGEGDSWKKP